MRPTIALLVNPTSARGRGERVGGLAERELRAGGALVRRLVGRDAAHAAELGRVAVADGVDRLVVVGGDGVVHLGANLLAGTSVPLGIVPAGTGNDVARSLGLPVDDPVHATAIAAGSTSRRIDLGRAGDRWFAGVLASGFDSRVNERANRMRWPRGRSRYDVAMLVELGVFRPLPYDLVLDGEPWRTEAMLVAVGNGPSYGGGMRVTPDARLDDGLLDVMVLRPVRRATLLRVFPLVYSGRHVTHPAVEVRRVRSVRLAAPGTTAWADGERIGPLPLEVAAVPGALRVLVPPLP